MLVTSKPSSPGFKDHQRELDLATKLAGVALSSPLVRRLNSEVLRYVGRASAQRSFEAGSLIAGANRLDNGLLLILRGHIGVGAQSADGLMTIDTLGPGEFCAAEPALASRPRLTLLIAKTAVDVLEIPYSLVRVLAAKDAVVAELIDQRSQQQNLQALLLAGDLRLRVSEALSEVAGGSRWVTIPERECIIADGTRAESIYLLARGTVDMTLPHPTRGFDELRCNRTGALLGRSSLLGANEIASTWTVEESCFLEIPRSRVEPLLASGHLALESGTEFLAMAS